MRKAELEAQRLAEERREMHKAELEAQRLADDALQREEEEMQKAELEAQRLAEEKRKHEEELGEEMHEPAMRVEYDTPRFAEEQKKTEWLQRKAEDAREMEIWAELNNHIFSEGRKAKRNEERGCCGRCGIM